MTFSEQRSYSTRSLFLPLFFWSMPFVWLHFTLPIISKRFGAHALEIGGLFSAFTVTTLVLRPIVGWGLDRFGRKSFFVASLFIYTFAMGLFAFAESLKDLYLARFIQGIGSALLWPAVNTIITDLVSPEARGQAMGKVNEITTRGKMVGIFAVFIAMSLLPQGIRGKDVFTAFAITTFLSAALAWKSVPNTRPVQYAFQNKSILSRPLLMLMFIVFITGLPESMLDPIYLTYLQDKFTTDMAVLAWAFLPGGLVAAFLSARLGSLSDRLGRIPIMAAGMAGAGVTSLLIPRLPSLIGLAVLYALSVIMWGLSKPAGAALVADLTGYEKRGRAYGLYDFVENLGFVIGPLLGGMLYDIIGSEIPFYLNGVLSIISASLVIAVLRPVLSKPVALLH